jgi:RNA recognition motif-containing protein
MPRKLYVSNLSPKVDRDELERLFAVHGTVLSVTVMDQRKTASGTGAGLVEMDVQQGDAAIAALNGRQHRDLALSVGWAKPGQATGLNLSRMFESMNIPDDGEHQQTLVPRRGGFGRTRPLR